jgi:hypothetical protein
MPVPSLTPSEWQLIRKNLVSALLAKTRSKTNAVELADAAIAQALEPTSTWNVDSHTEFYKHLYHLAWSRHGNESTSYRVKKASFAIDESTDRAPPSSGDPEKLVVKEAAGERAVGYWSALRERAKGDALVELLLANDEPEETRQEDRPPEAGELQDDEDEDAPKPPPPPTRETQPRSTQRALAAGYTLQDIKNARERLKRLALAVVRDAKKKDSDGQ